MFNRLTIVYWINKQQHEIVFHIRMNPNYDVFKFIDYQVGKLGKDSNIETIHVEFYQDKQILEVIKFKVNGEIVIFDAKENKQTMKEGSI